MSSSNRRTNHIEFEGWKHKSLDGIRLKTIWRILHYRHRRNKGILGYFNDDSGSFVLSRHSLKPGTLQQLTAASKLEFRFRRVFVGFYNQPMRDMLMMTSISHFDLQHDGHIELNLEFPSWSPYGRP